MSKAKYITQQILTVCEAISIEEVEEAYKWLDNILTSSGFQLVGVDGFFSGSFGEKMKDEGKFTLTYRSPSENKDNGSYRDEQISLVCDPKSKPFMTASFSFTGSKGSVSPNYSYGSLNLGGKSWDSAEEVKDGLEDWIARIKSSSVYRDMLDRLSDSNNNEEPEYGYDDAQGYEDDQYDQDMAEPIWF